MLQLSGTLRNATVRITPLSSWRICAQQLLAASSRAANPNPALAQAKEEIKPSTGKSEEIKRTTITSENPMIQAAFDNLMGAKTVPPSESEDNPITIKIKAAKNIESLLNIANDRNLKRQDAFAIVTLLLDWVNNGKANLEVFEVDSRFLRLCRLLSQPEKKQSVDPKEDRRSKQFMEQLNLFYNINEINEATKEVANLPLPHMVKIMSGLASQRRRSTPLLRALSFNISRSTKPLDIKQLSDLLYSMSILNYADEVLLQRACGDLMNLSNDSPKSSVIGSIIRSLGSLRYKNEELMDKLSEWVVDHVKEIRSQDVCSMFLTLAILGHTPSNVEVLNKVVVDPLKEADMSRPSDWLDVVWALTILQLAQDRHIAFFQEPNKRRHSTKYSNDPERHRCKNRPTGLWERWGFDRYSGDKQFFSAETDDIPVPKKHKLLNINAAAQLLMKGYDGPLLESDSSVFNVAVIRSKEKETYVKTVNTTLENIFPSPEYCQTNIDTGMGFVLDAEVCIDSQGKRLPVKCTLDKTKGYRLAVVAYYYHDFSRGKHALLGFNSFYCRLLEAKGYKILSIPHTEFNPEDKTVQRITYIYDRIKSITK